MPTAAATPKKNHHSAGKFTQPAIAGPREKASIPDDAIAALAYEKYQARGCVHGFDQQDWADALAELVARR